MIEFLDNRLCISFLEKDDFLATCSFSPDQKRVELEKVIKIKKQSGVLLNLASLGNLSDEISKNIFSKNTEYDLKIKNNNLRCFVYAVTHFQEHPDLVLFYFWEFETARVSMSRNDWLSTNHFNLHSCCLENYRLETLAKSTKIEKIKSLDDLDKFCFFDSSFVWVNVNYVINVLPLNKIEMEKQLKNLESTIVPFFSVNNKFNYWPSRTLFLYTSLFRKTKNADFNFFNDQSFSTQNCRDLLKSLNLNDETLKIFIFNMLYTVYQNQKLHCSGSGVLPKLEFKILRIEFEF